MANLTKTQGTTILTHQAITHPGTAVGTTQDVSTKLSATIVCFHASVQATVNINPGSFLIQISASSSGNEDWATVAQFTAASAAAVLEDLTATEPAGEKVLAVVSTTGFVATDNVYIFDTGTLTNSEWAKLEQIVSNTSLDLIDGLTTGKDSADEVWTEAETFVAQLDLTAVGRLRVIFQHEGGTGADVHVKVIMVTGDSIE